MTAELGDNGAAVPRQKDEATGPRGPKGGSLGAYADTGVPELPESVRNRTETPRYTASPDSVAGQLLYMRRSVDTLPQPTSPPGDRQTDQRAGDPRDGSLLAIIYGVSTAVQEKLTPDKANVDTVLTSMRLKQVIADPKRADLLVADNPVIPDSEDDVNFRDAENGMNLEQRASWYLFDAIHDRQFVHGDHLVRADVKKLLREDGFTIHEARISAGVEPLLRAGVLEKITPQNSSSQTQAFIVHERNMPHDVNIASAAELPAPQNTDLDAETLRRNVLANVKNGTLQDKFTAMQVLGILDDAVEAGLLPSTGEPPSSFTERSRIVTRGGNEVTEHITAYVLEKIINGEKQRGEPITQNSLVEELTGRITGGQALHAMQYMRTMGILSQGQERFEKGVANHTGSGYVIDAESVPQFGEDVKVQLVDLDAVLPVIDAETYRTGTISSKAYDYHPEVIDWDPMNPQRSFTIPEILTPEEEREDAYWIVSRNLKKGDELRNPREIAEDYDLPVKLVRELQQEIVNEPPPGPLARGIERRTQQAE